MNGNGSAKPLNGINKMVNGFNGNDIASTKVTNGFGSTNGDNGFDNWADFEHNQIYNASGKIYFNHLYLLFYLPTCSQVFLSIYLIFLPCAASHIILGIGSVDFF